MYGAERGNIDRIPELFNKGTHLQTEKYLLKYIYVDIFLQWDSDLDAKDEPETWSELVDKKVQRKMHAKDIKRQDVIYGKLINFCAISLLYTP